MKLTSRVVVVVGDVTRVIGVRVIYRTAVCEEDKTAEQHYKCDQHERQDNKFACAAAQSVPKCEETLEVPGHFEDPDNPEGTEESEDHEEVEVL